MSRLYERYRAPKTYDEIATILSEHFKVTVTETEVRSRGKTLLQYLIRQRKLSHSTPLIAWRARELELMLKEV